MFLVILELWIGVRGLYTFPKFKLYAQVYCYICITYGVVT